MPRLRARTFYGLIVAGFLLGAAAAAGVAWASAPPAAPRPEVRSPHADVVGVILPAVAAVMGGTFGGLVGVAAAVFFDYRFACRPAGTQSGA